MSNPHFWQRWPIALRWAVGLSLAVHLLVILPLSLMLETPLAMPQAPLSAVLKGPGEVVRSAPVTSKHLLPVSKGEAAKTARKPMPKPMPTRDDASTRSETRAVQAVAGTAQGETQAQPNVLSKAGIVGGAPDTVRDGVEADALNRYRLALGAEARKARRYPEVSRTRGQEGTAEVFVVLSRFGGGPVVVAGKSSGSPTLDEGALVMVRVAAERTPLPPELQGRNLKIPLRIRFSLDDF